MNVKELIARLSKCNPDLEVQLHYTSSWSNDSGTSFNDDHNSPVVSVAANKKLVLISVDYYPALEFQYGKKKKIVDNLEIIH